MFINRGGVLHTNIDMYTHPTNGNRVDVVGMSHFADPPFYDKIQAYLDDRTMAGAHVLYESVMESKPGEAVPKETVAKIELIALTAEMLGDVFKGAGFVSQLEELERRASWQNGDISVTEMVTQLGLNCLTEAVVAVGALKQMTSTMTLSGRRSLLTRSLQNSATHGSKNVVSLLPDEVVIDRRNDAVLSKMDKQEQKRPGSDFVLPWGQKHLPGLGVGLSKRGYNLKRQVLVPAIKL